MTAAEWITKRRELLDAATVGPWRHEEHADWSEPGHLVYLPPEDGVPFGNGGKRHDSAGLSILAMSDLPRALDALEAVLKEVWRIESGHHFHGTTCTCGYASHRARDRTEHLTRPLTDAIEDTLRPTAGGDPDDGGATYLSPLSSGTSDGGLTHGALVMRS